MTTPGFTYDIGPYKCIIFSDGILGGPEPGDEDTFGLNCLLIDTGDRNILIDAGCGEGFHETAGLLVSNMKAEGISCSDIDTIIITHGHIDHAAGCFDADGKPVYPNARYTASKSEYEYWKLPPGSNELHNMFFESARKNLVPIPEQFDLVEDNAEILPGIKLLPATGHSPGNIMVEISSAGKSLLCIGDIIHSHREFVDPEYLVRLDVDPEQAVATRAQVFSDVADSGQLVFACHFDFPGLGYITRKDGVLSWQPL